MYTPTHCPDTGRKFTRAERKAANKAKFQAEQSKVRKSKPASKRKQASKPVPTEKALMRLTKAELVSMLMGTQPKRESAPTTKSKPKAKAKAKVKTRKPSPTQRVADRQERAHHGRPDGVVKPTKVKRTADVAATRKTVQAVGAANAKRKAFELATHWAYSPNFGGRFLDTQQAELTRLLGATDVATYEDVVALTL